MLTIVESPEYIEALEKFPIDARLKDDIQHSFDFLLANDPLNPEYATPVLGFSGLYVFTTAWFLPRAPSFRVLYKYDPEEDINMVTLLHIEPVSDISEANW